MARGRKRGTSANRGGRHKKRKVVSKQDVHHYKEFGEVHPSEEHFPHERTNSTLKIKDEEAEVDSQSDCESDEAEEADSYQKLLSVLIPGGSNLNDNAVDSDDSEDLNSDQCDDAVSENESNSYYSAEEADEKSGSESDEFETEDRVDSGAVQSDRVERDSVTEEKEDPVDCRELKPDGDEHDCDTKDEFSETDPYFRHLKSELSEEMVKELTSLPVNLIKERVKWPTLGQLIEYLPNFTNKSSSIAPAGCAILSDENKTYAECSRLPKLIKSFRQEWSKLHINKQIQKNLSCANPVGIDSSSMEKECNFTELQNELFYIINSYKDLYYPECKQDESESVRFTYVLHAVNHVLKTRNEVVKHNASLANRSDVPPEFRDQGLVRPKVLLLLPFRETAFRVVQMMIAILVPGKKDNVINRKRFFEEFTGGSLALPKKNPKPEDYEITFSGNTDDNFKIGIAVTKKSLKLYTDFYSSDILVASPLGLRVLIGAEGEKDRDFDFLASLELLVMEGADIFWMQNWDHVIHIANHLHLQPSAASTTRCGTDFSRVHPWAVEGYTKHYRQTLIFSSSPLPGPSAFFASKCRNYEGAVRVANPVTSGSISQVLVQMAQVFHRLDAPTATEAIDARFVTFVNKVLPQYKDNITKHVMIYVPLYFDFVRIRNYFKKEDISFAHICEYSKDGKVAQARDLFFHGKAHFLLYSERFHFFRRIRVKGIKHIIFYQPPSYPHFYSEICNFMQAAYQRKNQQDSHISVAAIYSCHDAEQLAGIVGSDRASKMMGATNQNVHMFITGE